MKCCSGSFGLQTSSKAGGQDDVLLLSGAGDHLGADTLAGTVVFFDEHVQRCGQRSSKLEGYLLYGTPVNMLFSPGFKIPQYQGWLATGSAPRMALIWGFAYSSFNERATNEPKYVHFSRTTLEVAGWCYLRHFQLAFSNPWLVATVIDTRMLIQERE